MKIKFNTRKINTEFGVDADDFCYYMQHDVSINSIRFNRPLADRMVELGLARIDNRGPGRGLELFANIGKAFALGYVKQY